MVDSHYFKISPEVRAALEANKPVVALESTVIAHGLPQPQNFETALRLEAIVRSSGAVAATIAIIEGKFCVGLDQRTLERIATQDTIHKISIRDLAVAAAKHLDGATTVASTLWIAYRVGIRVFATGGIGGVHRGTLPDISADLPQLAQTPLVVVCSGAKLVLDLPATREWLETHGVSVLGYNCDEFPAFYLRRSGLMADARVNTPQEVAEIFRAQERLGIRSALVVGVPVPENEAMSAPQVNAILDEALRRASAEGIAGRDVTPFLLTSMARQSEGASLRANIALLENNARIAAEIAICDAQNNKLN